MSKHRHIVTILDKICPYCGGNRWRAEQSGKVGSEWCYDCRQELNKIRNTTIRRQIVFNEYGGKCSCPGCTQSNWCFLTIDHINNDGYLHAGKRGYRLCFKIVKDGYPTKYRLMCYNCNCGRQYAGHGGCPQEGEQCNH